MSNSYPKTLVFGYFYYILYISVGGIGMGSVTAFASLFRGYLEIPLNPFLYVGLLLLWLQYMRQNRVERDLFGHRITSIGQVWTRTILFGVVAGIIGSAVINGLGIVLSQSDMLVLWILAVILSLFETRFLCFAYAGGLLGLISLLLRQIPAPQGLGNSVSDVYNVLRDVSVTDILLLVAVLHALEACLIWFQGYQSALPVFVESRRGKIVGGFVLQNMWLVPLVAFVGLSQPASVFGAIAWNPPVHMALLDGQHDFHSYVLLPLPVMLGFSTHTLTKHPKGKARQSSLLILLYAIGLAALVIVGLRVALVLWIACLFSFVAHELLVYLDNKKEQQDTPIFIKPLRGLKLLAVFPKSPAEQMGLATGDTIVRVNGMPVNTTYDFHFAIHQNPAYVKLDVMDESGEIRFTGTPLFTGDSHRLGVILVPDENSMHYVTLYSSRIWSFVKRLAQAKTRSETSCTNRNTNETM